MCHKKGGRTVSTSFEDYGPQQPESRQLKGVRKLNVGIAWVSAISGDGNSLGNLFQEIA